MGMSGIFWVTKNGIVEVGKVLAALLTGSQGEVHS